MRGRRRFNCPALCVLVCGLWGIGCAGDGIPPGSGAPKYALGVFNGTSGPAVARVEGKGTSISTDGLPPDQTNGFPVGVKQLPPSVEVSWQDAAGRSHKQTVDVAGRVPRGFRDGAAFLKLKPDGSVAVVPARFSEPWKKVMRRLRAT